MNFALDFTLSCSSLNNKTHLLDKAGVFCMCLQQIYVPNLRRDVASSIY